MIQNAKEYGGIDSAQLELFASGQDNRAYTMLGAHQYENGYRFAVWAPNAVDVCIVGEFNGWECNHHMRRIADTGVWYTVINDISDGMMYKYAISTIDGKVEYKADPYAFYAELRPGTASKTANIDSYVWQDKKWETEKRKALPYEKPMLVYEVNLGSWRRHEDGTLLTYRELAAELVPYIKDMGYTHVELMPIAEHPFDGSWGYQITGYYAATSRYGEPEDFMYLVDEFHKHDIGVILDWVPAHFPRDAQGLRLFDGTPLYEYADPQMGEHKEWGTMVFNYARGEIVSFLISNAYFWMDKYHIDGLRVDAVSSMLYLDYNRKKGEWKPNKHGGRENIEAIALLRRLNAVIFRDFPGALMIAEESTAWPGITKPVHEGGLGFNYKWNMGWMNDTLKYMSMDPLFRKGNHSLLTFLMYYAFSENYILPLSHDEVVHGKKSLLDKMHGTYEQKFAQLKLYYAYSMAHPGKKLLFMGGEFGQFIEWRDGAELDWLLLDYNAHSDLHCYVRALNQFYTDSKPFWQIEDNWGGFEWINADDSANSILSFIRKGKAKSDYIVVLCNFTPVYRKGYTIGVPDGGEYEVVFVSDDDAYGGATSVGATYKAKIQQYNRFERCIDVDIPPFSAVFLRKKKAVRKVDAEPVKAKKKKETGK